MGQNQKHHQTAPAQPAVVTNPTAAQQFHTLLHTLCAATARTGGAKAVIRGLPVGFARPAPFAPIAISAEERRRDPVAAATKLLAHLAPYLSAAAAASKSRRDQQHPQPRNARPAAVVSGGGGDAVHAHGASSSSSRSGGGAFRHADDAAASGRGGIPQRRRASVYRPARTAVTTMKSTATPARRRPRPATARRVGADNSRVAQLSRAKMAVPKSLRQQALFRATIEQHNNRE